jgi:hypothetical protein
MRPRWLERIFNYWIYPLMHWPMQVRQFANLKRNAERHYQSRPRQHQDTPA